MKRPTVGLLSVLLFALCSCGPSNDPSPPVVPPGNELTAHFYWDELQVAYYSDSTVRPILGYKVSCSSLPGYSTVDRVTLDVGKATVCNIHDIGLSPGVWYCSVSAYDEIGRTAPTGEKAIKYENGNYSLAE